MNQRLSFNDVFRKKYADRIGMFVKMSLAPSSMPIPPDAQLVLDSTSRLCSAIIETETKNVRWNLAVLLSTMLVKEFEKEGVE